MALNKQMTALRNISVSRAEIARAKAESPQAQATLDRAEENLRNSTIVSPMDGIVLSRDVEVGDAVSSILVLGSQATQIMTLGDVSDVYVLGKVDEADIGKVYLGQPARIVVESFKDKKFDGKVTKISPLGVEKDNVTTFEVRVSIREPGRRAEGQHERQRRDHPRGEEERSAGARVGRDLRPAAQRVPGSPRSRPTRRAAARWRPSSASRTA